MNNTKKGFTLVELLVVIAILAILATVSVVGYTAFIDNAKDSRAQSELHQVVTYLQSAMIVDNELEVVVEGTTVNEAIDADDVKYVIKKTETGLTVKKYTAVVDTPENNGTPATYKWDAGTDDNNEFGNAVKAIAELKDFDGDFTVSGWTITYETTEGGEAEDTFDIR